MNIFFIEMEQQNLQFQKKLVEDGHNVVTMQDKNSEYTHLFGIETTDLLPYKMMYNTEYGLGFYNPEIGTVRVLQIVQEYDIDLVICSCPSMRHLVEKLNVPCINTSLEASQLETSKVFARKFAEECGIKVPEIYASGDNHLDFKPEGIPEPFIVKPSNWWHSASIVPNSGMWDTMKERWMNLPAPYFCEEMITGKETNISYIMSEGQWSFTFSESCDESRAKWIMNTDPCAWFHNTIVEQLTPEENQKIRDNVVEYLNQSAKLGGTYEGSITQMIGEDGDIYFLENNVRPYVHNTFPLPLGGNEYLDAFQNNPQKIGDCFTGRKFPKLVFQGGSEYPLHLNTKYKIAEPTGISVKEDKYIVESSAVITVFEDEINMDFVNELEKESDFKAYWGD